MGQALLPEHFYAQERALTEEQSLRWSMLPAPQTGLASFSLNEFKLREGFVVVESLVLFLPSGTVIDIPGNTEAPDPFPLSGPGSKSVSVFLHLLSQPRILGSERAGTPDEESIERIVYKVALSTDDRPEHVGSQLFELARFVQGPRSEWSLDPGFIPECVQTDLPFFETHIEKMRQAVDVMQNILAEDVLQNFLSSETFISSQQCLRGVIELRNLLADLEASDINPHPYDLYAALRRFYVDLSIYRRIDPRRDLVYRHSGLGEIFETLAHEIKEHIERTRQDRPYAEFREEEGLQVCTLTVAAKRARDVYLMIEKPSVSAVVDANMLKLASKSRVQVVRVHSLRGIVFTHIANPPFRHGFSAQMEFYRLQPGPEWDYAVTEGKVGFQPPPELKGLRSFLYWPGD